MIAPAMTRIGEPQRTIEDVPMPMPVRRRVVPMPKPGEEPEKVPVRVTPSKEPRKEIWNRIGLEVTEIPYYCPECGREMEMEDGTLYCLTHGVMYE